MLCILIYVEVPDPSTSLSLTASRVAALDTTFFYSSPSTSADLSDLIPQLEHGRKAAGCVTLKEIGRKRKGGLLLFFLTLLPFPFSSFISFC